MMTFRGKQAGFDDDLQEPALAGSLNGGDFCGQLVPLGFLRPADVDDHIHFIGTIVHGIGSHEALVQAVHTFL